VSVRFLRIARAELHGAIEYYESQAPNLGAIFLLEVVSATERISRFPAAWQPVDHTIRRSRLGRFPYALIYVEEGKDILILAVAHLHKRPERWRVRMERDDLD
jgi:toxin ParE2